MSYLYITITQECDLDFLKAFDGSSNTIQQFLQEAQTNIESLKGCFASASLLICILAKKVSEESTLIRDDVMDHGMRAMLTFVANLCLKPDTTKSEKSSSNKKSSSSLIRAKLIMEIARVFSPVFSTYIDSLCLLLKSFRQSEKTIFHASEFVMNALKVDITMADTNVPIPSGFVLFQKESIRLLQCLTNQYPHVRQSVVLDLLPLLADSYNSRTPMKLYSLSYSADSEENRIPASLAALLTVLQSSASVMSVMNNVDSLAQYRSLCALTCKEILERASHKDLCVIYRQLAFHLVSDLMTVLTNAEFIIAPTLLAIMFRLIAGKIQSFTGDSARKRDVSFFNFLLDLLGSCGSSISELIIEERGIKDVLDMDVCPPQLRNSVIENLNSLVEKFTHVENGTPRTLSALEDVVPVGIGLKLLSEVFAATLETVIDYLKYFENRKLITWPNARSLLALSGIGNRFVDRLQDVDDMDVLYFSVANYLKLKNEKDFLSNDAHEFLLRYWLSDVSQGNSIKDFINGSLLTLSGNSDLSVGVLQASRARNEQLRHCNSQEWVKSVLRRILVSRELKPLLNIILGSILLSFTEGSPLVRARAMKSLGSLIRVDKEISAREEVQETIKERLHDSAICVREEAVKLVGFLFLRNTDIENTLLDSLIERLHDTGVSVRKAVVSIIRDLLERRPDFPGYSELCVNLIQLNAEPKEEDSIRDLVRLTFQQLWFLPPCSAACDSHASRSIENKTIDTEFLLGCGWKIFGARDSLKCDQRQMEPSAVILEAPNGKKFGSVADAIDAYQHAASSLYEESKADRNDLLSGVVPIPSADLTVATHLEVTAMQIAGVACHLKDPQWVISIIRDVLDSKAEGSGSPVHVQRKREASLKHCSKLMACLVELLVRCEEVLARATAIETRQEAQQRLTSIILGISLLSRAHPPFLLPYVHHFLPYLKGENGLSFSDECLLILSITEMLEAATAVPGFTLGSRIDELNDDLSKIALKFSDSNIHAAISCMTAVALKVSRDAKALMDLGERCFRSIRQVCIEVQSSNVLSKEQAARLQRCVVVLGYICEHSRKCTELLGVPSDNVAPIENFDENIALSSEKVCAANMCEICYSAIVFSLKLHDKKLHLRATQALCSVFLGCPKFIIHANTSGLLRKLFETEQGEEIHCTLVTCLKNMMLSEERRLEMTVMGDVLSRDSSCKAPTESDSDFTPAGFVLQEYLSRLISFLRGGSKFLRISTLELIKTLLLQGMLCPLDVISPLVALQGDTDPIIREESLRLLVNEEQKHPRFLESKILDGIDVAYDQHYANDNAFFTSNDGRSIFSDLYSLCFASNRRRRNELLTGLLKKCLQSCIEFNDGNQSLISHNEYLRVKFLISTLATLKFQVLDEPLYIIYWISRNVPVTSAILANIIKKQLAEMGSVQRVEGMMQGPVEGATSKHSGKKRPLHRSYPPQQLEWSEELLVFESSIFSTWFSKAGANEVDVRLKVLTSGYFAWQSIILLMKLKAILTSKYNLTNEQFLAFNPEEKGNSERIKFSEEDIGLDLSGDEGQSSVDSLLQSACDAKSTEMFVRHITAEFNKWQLAMDNESHDFNISRSGKRGRRLSKNPERVAGGKSKNKKRIGRKARFTFAASEDEEYEDSSASDFEDI